jgi:hypothetical protein
MIEIVAMKKIVAIEFVATKKLAIGKGHNQKFGNGKICSD